METTSHPSDTENCRRLASRWLSLVLEMAFTSPLAGRTKASEQRDSSLPEELSARKLIRGQTLFGLAGDCLDEIAGRHHHMQWWVSDKGLSMAILGPELPVLPPFDELAGRLTAGSWRNGGLESCAVTSG